MRIDVEKLRSYLSEYHGTAMLNGFPAALLDLSDLENMDDYELCEKAEAIGMDLRKFEVVDDEI